VPTRWWSRVGFRPAFAVTAVEFEAMPLATVVVIAVVLPMVLLAAVVLPA
jgi:hypothetical protein